MLKRFKKVCCAMLALTVVGAASSYTANAEEKKATIHIVHTNDMHGYYKSSGDSIGFSALKQIIDDEGADLVLDAGDTFHGQSFATVEQGKSIAELMDEVGYDAMTPGNHDWSYGAQRVKELDEESNFAVLASNVVTENGSEYFENPYLVKDVTADDGTQLKVGVLGVIDDSFYTSTAANNVKGLTFTEEAQKASEIASTLREKEKCDVVIAITHQNDCEGFVANSSGIDAVIAGHQHILIDKTYADKEGRQVKVVEANYYFKNIGVLSLTVENDGTVVDASEKVYSSDATQEMSDEAVDGKISEIENREEAILSEVVGTSSKEYVYSWEEVRTHEQEIGRIITSAYLDYTGADVAFENAGGIRGGLPNGDITYSNIISISPYGNVLVEKELTGRQIVDILECSLDINAKNDAVYTLQKEATAKGEDPYQYSWPDNSGSALQFGGITAEYDMSKPYGQRASDIKIGGNPVDMEKVYRVVTNNYAADNADYSALAQTPLSKEYTTCEQVLQNYIAKGTFEAAAAKANIVPKSADTPTESIPSESNTEESKPDESKPASSSSAASQKTSSAAATTSKTTVTTRTTSTYTTARESVPQTSGQSFAVGISAAILLACSAVLLVLKNKSTNE